MCSLIGVSLNKRLRIVDGSDRGSKAEGVHEFFVVVDLV